MNGLWMKEIRQISPWAGLLFLGHVLILLMVIADAAGAHDSQMVERTLFSSGGNVFLLLMVFGSALVGLGPAGREARQGYWAFLVHRPVSRMKLFMTKLAVGAAACLSAFALPWLLFHGYLAVVDPIYEGSMLFIVVADGLLQVPAFLVGLVIGLWRPRLLLARILPLGLLLLLMAWHLGEFGFWLEILASMIVTVLAGSLAWNLFKHDGDHLRSSGWWSGNMMIHVLPAIVLLLFGSSAVVVSLLQRSYDGWERQWIMTQVTLDGQFVRCVIDENGRRYEDMDGKAIEKPALLEDTTSHLARLRPGYFGDYRRQHQYFRHVGNWRGHNVNLQLSTGRLFMYLHDGDVKILDYGFPGQNIEALHHLYFHKDTGREHTAAIHSRSVQVTRKGIYLLDLDAEQVLELFKPDAGDTIVAAGGSFMTNPSPSGKTSADGASYPEGDLFIWTEKHLLVMTPVTDGFKPRMTIDLSAFLQDESLAIAGMDDGTLLIRSYNTTHAAKLWRVSADGKVDSGMSLPADSTVVRLSDGRFFNYAFVAPPVVSASIALVLLRKPRDVLEAVGSVHYIVGGHGLAVLLSMCAVLLLARKRMWPRGWLAYLLGCVLFSWAIPVVMFLIGVKPGTRSCHACGAKTAIDGPCRACGVPRAAPSMDGSELFEPAA